MDIQELKTTLENSIEKGAANARYPVDWFKIGLPLIKVAERATEHCAFYPCDESPLAFALDELNKVLRENNEPSSK